MIGKIDPTGIYRPSGKGELGMSVHELLGSSPALINSIVRSRPKEEDARAIRESCEKDRAAGFASDYFSKEELDQRFGLGGWVPLPTFNHVQSTGKSRRIDNGLRSKHNLATSFAETLELCTASQPAITIKTFVELHCAISGMGSDPGLQNEVFESGGEDMPDAYRWLPVDVRQLCVT